MRETPDERLRRREATEEICARALDGGRLSEADAIALCTWGDWTVLARAAHDLRLRLHPPDRVSYTGFRVVNYTNYCTVGCTFCSFMDEVGSGKGYVLSLDDIARKTEEAIELGADQIFLQGGVHPDLPLSYYLDALRMLRDRFGVHVRGFSPVELLRLAETLGVPLPDLIAALRDAGLRSVPGAGAEILAPRMRALLAPKKLSKEDWCAVMGACHEAGLPGSANIVVGSIETPEEVVEHLAAIRDQQDRTHGFLSFVPWTFQPQTKGFPIRHVRADEYLRLLSLARLFFDNIAHIEVSILGLGKELGELALHAGADDINSFVIEENVLASRGLKTLRAAERFIREAGFTPARRSLNYDFS